MKCLLIFPRPVALSLLLIAAACAGLPYVRQVHSQQALPSTEASIQTTTAERVESEPWWPTKTTFSLASYAGSAACVKCHADESSTTSAMQHAATPADKSSFLAGGHEGKVTLAPYVYALAGAELSVEHAGTVSKDRIAWDFGAGDLAHTFLFERDSRWYQSQVTWYTRTATLDTTTGFNTLEGGDLKTALGQKLSGEEARKCFSCHTVHATTSAGFNPSHAEPGLGCEACHGPGKAHVEQASAGSMKPAQLAAAGTSHMGIFNPAALSPGDAVEFCGACHRTTMDAALAAGPHSLGKAMVRFQPYRLEQSHCWRATQSERLTCTACHNPHEPLEKAAVKYDRSCLGCHATIAHAPAPQHVAKLATASQQTCVSCHMPKVEVASMHGEFTDHRIRVVRPGEGFPE